MQTCICKLCCLSKFIQNLSRKWIHIIHHFANHFSVLGKNHLLELHKGLYKDPRSAPSSLRSARCFWGVRFQSYTDWAGNLSLAMSSLGAGLCALPGQPYIIHMTVSLRQKVTYVHVGSFYINIIYAVLYVYPLYITKPYILIEMCIYINIYIYSKL